MAEPFVTSSAEQPLDVINVFDLEEAAKKVIPQGAYGYISSGAQDLYTIQENIKAFNHKLVAPRVLQDIEFPADMHVDFMDHRLTSPIIMAPVAAHKLANTQGEVATARAVGQHGTIFTISSFASETYEAQAAVRGDSPQWFQLYQSKDDGATKQMLDTAKQNGAEVIVLTADATVGGYREADKRNHFTFPVGLPIVPYEDGQDRTMDAVYKSAKQSLSPRDIDFIKSYTGLPVYVKGVQTAADAEVAIRAGADGIWVSNHGGRQLDGGVASFDALQVVASQVAHRVPIVFDSGVRRGMHVFKALASGADLVAIGRPVIYGLALGGSQGVEAVFNELENELLIAMQLTGSHNVAEIKRTQLIDNNYAD